MSAKKSKMKKKAEVKKVKKTAGRKSKKEKKKESPESRSQMVIKDITDTFYKFRFYPVALKDFEEKENAKKHLVGMYREGDEYVKQSLLYLCHEGILQYFPYKHPPNFDFHKARMPEADAAKVRFGVYRTMFNFNSSLEGVLEIIGLLGELNDQSSAKALTHLFSFFSCHENESSRVIRNAIIDAMGKTNSVYSFRALISYAKVIESERLFSRIINSLLNWEEKINRLEISREEKTKMRKELAEILSVGKTEFTEGYVR
ncbi:hypothetical protein JXB01_03300 [Candidatus Micrarchaeota archaeon]|nr:hypothetical protein [Candidatus Micrarchaeota archaeon]